MSHDESQPAEGRRVDNEVMFLEDLVTALRVSRVTIERRRKEGTFPIPELERLDRRPRWSRRAVERYLTSSVGLRRRPYSSRIRR